MRHVFKRLTESFRDIFESFQYIISGAMVTVLHLMSRLYGDAKNDCIEIERTPKMSNQLSFLLPIWDMSKRFLLAFEIFSKVLRA